MEVHFTNSLVAGLALVVITLEEVVALVAIALAFVAAYFAIVAIEEGTKN
jgi:hypothetical protein